MPGGAFLYERKEERMADYLSPLAAPFEFAGDGHGVLLIHGYTGSPAHMRPLGERLRDAGFSVTGILLPGHGTDAEDMRKVSWQDWVLAAREAAGEMRKKYAFFSVAGLSMGGLLSLLIASEGTADACVSIASPMRTRQRFRGLAPLLAKVYPTVRKRGESRGVDAEYDVGYDCFPTSSVHDLNVIMRLARQGLPLIRCPLLAVQSRRDETVTEDSPEIILREAGSEKKAALWLQDAPHVCTISPEMGKIADGMIRFLRECEAVAAAEKGESAKNS